MRHRMAVVVGADHVIGSHVTPGAAPWRLVLLSEAREVIRSYHQEQSLSTTTSQHAHIDDVVIAAENISCFV